MSNLRPTNFLPKCVNARCVWCKVSSATFYKWRTKYGGMNASLMARMKELEAENARLRKMVVEENICASSRASGWFGKCPNHLLQSWRYVAV